MPLTELELWLDESGDFLSDNAKMYYNPSLVGGVLLRKGTLNDTEIKSIIGKDRIHFTEEDGAYNTAVMSALSDRDVNFIVFENHERLLILDSDTTYLNILTEGIIQLLLKLSAKYGDFELDILVATRKNTVQGRGILMPEEYKDRLKEKVILGLARNVLTKKVYWKYRIEFGDARENIRLMVADCVCNTYLTRTSGKFNGQEKELIQQLYSKENIFTVFPKELHATMDKRIAEGDLGSALFETFFNDELKDVKDRYVDSILHRFEAYDEFGLKVNLKSVINKVEALIKVDKNNKAIKPVLESFQNELIPKLEKNNLKAPEFVLDVILYLYTIYTHEGSIEAEHQDKLFLEAINKLEDVFERIKYYVIYKNRQAIHQKNMLDLNSSLKNISMVIESLEQIDQLFTIVDNLERENAICEKNEMLAKAYGTRIQAWTMRINTFPEYIEKARSDYEKAKKNFSNRIDIERINVNLCFSECEAGNFNEALSCLLASEWIDYSGPTSIELFIDRLSGRPVRDVIYKYLCYIRIMSYARQRGEEISKILYDCLVNGKRVNVESFKNEYHQVHPLEDIYWCMGDYCIYIGKTGNGNRFYNLGIEIIGESEKELTLKIKKMGIIASKALSYFLDKNQQEYKKILERLLLIYSGMKEKNVNSSILDYIIILDSLEDGTGNDISILREFIAKTKCMN